MEIEICFGTPFRLPPSSVPPLEEPLSSLPQAASTSAPAAPSAAIERKRAFFLIISFRARHDAVAFLSLGLWYDSQKSGRFYSARAFSALASDVRLERLAVTRSR